MRIRVFLPFAYRSKNLVFPSPCCSHLKWDFRLQFISSLTDNSCKSCLIEFLSFLSSSNIPSLVSLTSNWRIPLSISLHRCSIRPKVSLFHDFISVLGFQSLLENVICPALYIEFWPPNLDIFLEFPMANLLNQNGKDEDLLLEVLSLKE